MGPLRKLRRPGYDKLDAARQEIRLLILKKAAKISDDIHCELRTTSLAKRPRPIYHTVSYVWDDEHDKRVVYLYERRIRITASAEQVLRRFRWREFDRILWIDALCINQIDIAERSQQVAIMHEIFTECARNLTWLGEDDGSMPQTTMALNAVYQDA